MQTFLPYLNFKLSAQSLDHKRLGKQRVETLQLLQANNNLDSPWRNHPVFRMWYGYPVLLAAYGVAMCEQWVINGYADTCKTKILATLPCDKQADFALQMSNLPFSSFPVEYRFPIWMTSLQYHITSEYRSILLAKNPDFYGKLHWQETPKEKMNYPLFPTVGDKLEDETRIDNVIFSDCQGNGMVEAGGHMLKVEHVKKITNSVNHIWRKA